MGGAPHASGEVSLDSAFPLIDRHSTAVGTYDKARYHRLMHQSLSSLIPTADELLSSELWRLGLTLLIHMKSHE